MKLIKIKSCSTHYSGKQNNLKLPVTQRKSEKYAGNKSICSWYLSKHITAKVNLLKTHMISKTIDPQLLSIQLLRLSRLDIMTFQLDSFVESVRFIRVFERNFAL